jgi:hypothetical protein
MNRLGIVHSRIERSEKTHVITIKNKSLNKKYTRYSASNLYTTLTNTRRFF